MSTAQPPERSALENDMSEAAFVSKKLIVCLGMHVGDSEADRVVGHLRWSCAERRLWTSGFKLFQDLKA